MKQMTFYAYERDIGTGKARARQMKGYHAKSMALACTWQSTVASGGYMTRIQAVG